MTNNVNSITLLGTGTSSGVPMLGCRCEVCLSHDPRNKRLRTGALIHTSSGKRILIDMGPDLRTQLLREDVRDIEGAILTHDHADHAHGIDDLRSYCFLREHDPYITVLSHQKCIESMTSRFPYIFQRHNVFKDKKILGGGIPHLEFAQAKEGPQEFLGEKFYFFICPHGHTETLSVVHGKMAYIVDVFEIPKRHLDYMRSQNLEVLIIDCLRRRPHDTHLHLEKTLKYIDYIQPKIAGLTHLTHEFDHQKLSDDLTREGHKHIRPLTDGEKLTYNS